MRTGTEREQMRGEQITFGWSRRTTGERGWMRGSKRVLNGHHRLRGKSLSRSPLRIRGTFRRPLGHARLN